MLQVEGVTELVPSGCLERVRARVGAELDSPGRPIVQTVHHGITTHPRQVQPLDDPNAAHLHGE